MFDVVSVRRAGKYSAAYFSGSPADCDDVIPLRRNASVRETLRAMMMATTLSALLLACVAFVGCDLLTARTALERDLTTLADVIGSNSAAALMFGDRDSAAQILEALRARPSLVAARIYSADGKPFATRRTSIVDIPDTAPREAALWDDGHFYVVRRIMFRGDAIGTVFIESDLHSVKIRLRNYAFSAAAILIVSILVALAVSSRLQRVLSNPIDKLAGLAHRVRRERDYSLRSDGTAKVHEIEELMSAFNEMLAEIQRRDEQLEEEVAKQTAELRTAKSAAESLSRHTQMILNTAAEGIFELDQYGSVTFANLAAARMLGYAAEELVGQRLHDLVHIEEMHALSVRDCPVCSAFLHPPVRSGFTTTFRARDGRRFPVEYATSSVPSENAYAGVVVTFRDVTSRVQVERMKDEFVSTVSHELRTPLTSIRGALGLVASGALGPLGDRAHRMLDIAVANTDRLVRMINEILDLERISSGRVELNRSVTSASEVMRDAVDVVQSVADRASVAISYEPDYTLLWIDRDRIVQTLTNLLDNAVKFSPPGASVSLRGGAAGEMFAFTVEDRGRGIPPDKLDNVFERFRQVDASDSRDKGGTGLGLAICRSIVSAHGGSIAVASTPGAGSTFRFTVPLATSSAPRVEPASPARSTFRHGDAVLIVEDDSDLARVISATLESHGLRSIVVGSGEEAIALCRSATPALVILDLMLPRLDGFAVVAWLREQGQLASLPLLVYSAAEVSVADQMRLRLGPTTFLTKSRVSMTDLEHHVRAMLEEPAYAT